MPPSIAGFRNILTNKVAAEIIRHYSNSDPVEESARLCDIYIDSFSLEFGDLLQRAGVQETLVALAISTSAFLHMAHVTGESPETVAERAKQARVCVTCQLYNFGTLFPTLLDDSDSD
jgi:hypothetical protein